MPPKVIAKGERASGVLHVSAAARAASAKQGSARLKLEIRRLPPSLTLAEFEDILGPEWKLGAGRVDWREYRQGKVKAPGKLPEQSRCYVHVINDAFVKEFEDRFLAVVFHDKAGTHRLPELKFLPPTVGYAPSQRIPLITGKQRIDNRQGTIDQDAEFIAFLEAETQPVVKPAAIGTASLDKDESRVEVKSTPLIDDLREKKANKAKAAASKAEKKGHKHSESKESAAALKDTVKSKDKSDAKKAEQVVKDAAKPTARQARKQTVAVEASPTQPAVTPTRKKKERAVASPKPAAAAASAATGPIPASPAAQKGAPAQRPRRDAEGIKKMLQKDLGIKPKEGTTPPTGPRARAGTPTKASTVLVAEPSPTTSADVASTTTPIPAPPAFKAFLKHANPSQGMTELLIKDTLSQYGDVISVTIDPRKGTAIAVFSSQDSLQKAIIARKVNVANGAIEVLEFKDRGAGAGSRGTRGAPRTPRSRGNAPATSQVQSAAILNTTSSPAG